MVILLFISVIMPANWEARYIPFFWYLFGFLAMAGGYKSRLNKKIFIVCFIIVIINNGFFWIFNTVNCIRHTIEFKYTLKEMKERTQDTIHIVLVPDRLYFHHSITEKIRYYNIHKNIIFIEDENVKYSNGVPFSHIKGWY